MSRKPVPAQAGDRARLEILFDRPQLLGRLFGEYDQNLVAIENRLGVYVSARGNRVQIEGEAGAAARAREVLTGLYNRIAKGEDVDAGMVDAVIQMSAEPTLAWQGILDDAVPRAAQAIRLYTGYLGDVFGYLPTAKQVREGGYEVNGFQSLFGMSGLFDQSRIHAAVTDCVRSAVDDLDRVDEGAVSRTGVG